MTQIQHSRLESVENHDLWTSLDDTDKGFAVVDGEGNRLFAVDELLELDLKRFFVFGMHDLFQRDRLNSCQIRVRVRDELNV